jgi:hypothetical protein
MGIFGLIVGYGELVIPQIGWLYALPTLAFKNMPEYFIKNIPDWYFLRDFYVNLATFLDSVFELGIELPVVGAFINSVLSMTLMQMILPSTVLLVIMLLLAIKAVKLVRDLF